MTDHESLLKASAELRDDVSLVLVQDNEVRCYRGDGIGPIIDAGGEKLHRLANAAVADRVIGKAAAVLFVLGGVRAVRGEVMSVPAEQFLKSHGVTAQFGTLVPHIINRTGDGMCPFEECVLPFEDPTDACLAIIAQLRRFGQGKRADLLLGQGGKDV